MSAPFARALNVEPLVSRGQMTFLLWNARADSSKAQRELGFVPTPLERGLAVTAEFLKAL